MHTILLGFFFTINKRKFEIANLYREKIYEYCFSKLNSDIIFYEGWNNAVSKILSNIYILVTSNLENMAHMPES